MAETVLFDDSFNLLFDEAFNLLFCDDEKRSDCEFVSWRRSHAGWVSVKDVLLLLRM